MHMKPISAVYRKKNNQTLYIQRKQRFSLSIVHIINTRLHLKPRHMNIYLENMKHALNGC